MNLLRGLAAVALTFGVTGSLAAQEKTTISITRQPGILLSLIHI